MTAASNTPAPNVRHGLANVSPMRRTALAPFAESRYSASATGTSAKPMLSNWYVRSSQGRGESEGFIAVDWSPRATSAVSRSMIRTIA